MTGVVLADGSQFVGLQDTDVKALKGLPLIFVHNHTEEVGASDDDLRSAFDAGAQLLIVITPSGREQVYVRGRGRMVLVRDEQASYEVGSPTLDETIELAMKSAEQARAYLDDPPEYVFLQDERDSYVPLTPGQVLVVENLLTQEIESLTRAMLIALMAYGMPARRERNDFVDQLKSVMVDGTSDAQALGLLEIVASSDWNALVAHVDSPESILLQEEQSEAQEPQPIGEQSERYVSQSIVADTE